MDFDDAKENIQPLAQGRNASILQASLKVESSQELLAQRMVLEQEIHNYNGDDPLSVWYNYIEWIEQSFPSGGKESGLQEVLSKCLAQFESDERYKQDRRMVKLYIKFIDSHKDPAECYQQLYSAGIGTMVADFYIAWAYCYDLVGNDRMADEIFLRGIACRAKPLEDLQEARQHFGFSVAQRLMYKDDDPIREETNRQLHERRMALSSLRGHRSKKLVGSTRTGLAVKSAAPGTVKIDLPSTSSQRGNIRVPVYKDKNENPNVISAPSNESTPVSEMGKSIVRSIIDAARNQENQKEPGPWNKAYNQKKGKLFGKSTNTSELGFEIHEDIYEDIDKLCVPPITIGEDEIRFNKPFIYPPNFCAKSKPIKGWNTPVTIEEVPDINTLPEYNKCKLYPRPNMEFQPEELKAYNILKKHGIRNNFTNERDMYWCCGPKYNIRLYPHFATKSKTQLLDSMDHFFIPEKLPGLTIAFEDIYKKEGKIERSFEEILALHIKRNETIMETADMEETMCTISEKVQRRKSFFPLRKSLAHQTFANSSKMSAIPEKYEKLTTVSEQSFGPSIWSADSEAVKKGEFGEKTEISNENNGIKESQALKMETAIPVVSEFLLDDDKSRKLLIKKTSETKMQSKAVTEKDVIDPVSPKPSEIIKDDGLLDVDCIKTMPSEHDFHFKTPALPTSVTSVSNKLPFQIFDDENLMQENPISIAKTDFSSTGALFDPEETCSTQTFNIFLKAQSVSTPKVVKSKPQRQFGNILKEVIQPALIEQKDESTDNQNFFTDNQSLPHEAPAVIAYSPARQQLSTILETSEHGTTQGTHTTGATTKSTLSSPEFDADSKAQTTNTGANQPQIVLETVKELSCEASLITMNSPKVPNKDTIFSEKHIETPGAVRLQKKCSSDVLNSSIFEDSIKKGQRQVGNFSRLEEKEDTAAGSVFKTLPAIRFQDDKTETISKMLITSQQIKFQDDKTETISKMMFEPLIPTKFEEVTGTISTMLMNPQQPKFPEDKTETISKFMLVKCKDAESELEKTEKHQEKNVNIDDCFEFFGQTPPKPVKQIVTKQMEQCSHSLTRPAANNRTPLKFDPKRFCDKDTPETQKTKSLLFSDEFQPYLSKHPTGMRNTMKDLLLEENQAVLTQNIVKPKSKSVFRDSFSLDFSVIDDPQPQIKQSHSENQPKTLNESTLPEFSLIKSTQPKLSKTEHNNSQNLSILSDFYNVRDTQNNESIIKSSQSLEPRYMKQSSKPLTNVITNSITDIEDNKLDDNVNWKQTPSTVSQKTEKATALNNILMDTFVKDFSEINEPPPLLNNSMQITLGKPIKHNSSLKFLNESLQQKSFNPTNITENNSKICNIFNSKETKLTFLSSESSEEKLSNKQKHLAISNNDKYFELNCETDMFGTNISMIKNSTWLPNHGPNVKQFSQILEKSLHIKSEEVSSNPLITSGTIKQILSPEELRNSKLSSNHKSLCNNNLSIEISSSELAAINDKGSSKDMDNPIVITESPEHNSDDNNMSIYYKQTPKTPKLQIHIWDDADDSFKKTSQNQYIHPQSDLNQTQQMIENLFIDPNINPFNIDLINAFLEQHYVISYLESLPTCKLVGCVHRLKQNEKININDTNFNVMKLIGEGAYGAVFCGKEMSTGKLVAMKQEKPPNIWEYYICLEIQERIQTDEMLHAYMSVDYALIGNNSSILISKYSQYGSLITVCNKIKKHTMKNVDEYVVMLLTSELLEIMDHLHAVNIIHADVKADNFLLMKKLTYPPTERHLQLIDFGVSIDMKLFKEGQTFSFVHNDNSFKCPEMRERRPWTYQLDLYGLAAVIHVLLFGKYMDIEKKARGFWMHKAHVPRYLNKDLWDEIFKTLLNIRDCKSMPNLQDLRALLKKELEEKEKYVLKMITDFNRALSYE